MNERADEYRGDICERLRDTGQEWLADSVGGLSDEFIQDLGESARWSVDVAVDYFMHGGVER